MTHLKPQKQQPYSRPQTVNQSSTVKSLSKMLNSTALFLGYLTFLILSPAVWGSCGALLPAEWCIGRVGFLVGNCLTIFAGPLRSCFVPASVATGERVATSGVGILGGKWIGIATSPAVLVHRIPNSDTAIAIFRVWNSSPHPPVMLGHSQAGESTNPLDGPSFPVEPHATIPASRHSPGAAGPGGNTGPYSCACGRYSAVLSKGVRYYRHKPFGKTHSGIPHPVPIVRRLSPLLLAWDADSSPWPC